MRDQDELVTTISGAEVPRGKTLAAVTLDAGSAGAELARWAVCGLLSVLVSCVVYFTAKPVLEPFVLKIWSCF